MLTTDEIIDLYHRKEYNTITSDLKINYNQNPNLEIIKYTIDNLHVELFTQFFNSNTVTSTIIASIINKPQLYSILVSMVELDLVLRENIRSVIKYSMITYDVVKDNNIEFLNIILNYLQYDDIEFDITTYALICGKINIIDILFNREYNIEFAFGKIIRSPLNIKIKYNTIACLSKYNINLLNYIKDITIFCLQTNQLTGLKFCLENGTNLDIFSDAYWIKQSIRPNDTGLDIFICLSAYGIDMSNYFRELLVATINNNCPNTLKHLIILGADIHFENDLLLYYACYMGNIGPVEILVEYGAIHDDILLFVDKNQSEYQHMYSDSIVIYNYKNWFQIAKLLIKSGAKITNPTHIFYTYLGHIIHTPIDIELFTLLLDLGIDFRYNCMFQAVVRCGIELTKLCLQYGADIHINNYGPLRSAITWNRPDVVKLLLELGSILDPELELTIRSDMKCILDEFGINYKLKKLI